MSKQTFARVADDKYEIQRLRLLLDAMTRRKKTRGAIIEMEATKRGFRIIVTAPTDADEQTLIGALGRKMVALSRGAMNFAKERERLAVDGGASGDAPGQTKPSKSKSTDASNENGLRGEPRG